MTDRNVIGCKSFCPECWIDKTPLSHAREYDDEREIRRPIADHNPGRAYFSVPEPDYHIVTAKP